MTPADILLLAGATLLCMLGLSLLVGAILTVASLIQAEKDGEL